MHSTRFKIEYEQNGEIQESEQPKSSVEEDVDQMEIIETQNSEENTHTSRYQEI